MEGMDENFPQIVCKVWTGRSGLHMYYIKCIYTLHTIQYITLGSSYFFQCLSKRCTLQTEDSRFIRLLGHFVVRWSVYSTVMSKHTQIGGVQFLHHSVYPSYLLIFSHHNEVNNVSYSITLIHFIKSRWNA